MRRPDAFWSLLATLALAAPAAGQAVRDDLPKGWFVLESHRINEPREQGSAISSTTGIRASMLGFRALDGDLACGQISVSFVHGHTRWVEPGADRLLEQGKLYVALLLDDEEELLRVNYTCTPVSGTRATLQVLARG